MKPALSLLAAALGLTVAVGAAQATTTLTAITSAGAGTVDASGTSFTSNIALDCGIATSCVAASFAGGAVSLGASFDPGFSAVGRAETEDATPMHAFRMHAFVSLSLVDGRFSGDDRLWFINANSGVETELTLAPPTSAEAGALVLFQPRYRFSGAIRRTVSGDVDASTMARARAASVLGAQGLSCETDPAAPDFCVMQGLPVTYGSPFPYETWLDVDARALVRAGSDAGVFVDLTVDYSHTLELVGAQVLNNKGQVLTGWTLSLADEGTVLLTSPVPEPASGLLAAVGVLALTGWTARRRLTAAVRTG